MWSHSIAYTHANMFCCNSCMRVWPIFAWTYKKLKFGILAQTSREAGKRAWRYWHSCETCMNEKWFPLRFWHMRSRIFLCVFFTVIPVCCFFFKCFVLAKCLFWSSLALKNIARNRILRPVFPRLPFVFGTVSAERFADSFGGHCQHVHGHIDVTPLPRACGDQKPGTAGFQRVWHVLLHVLPTVTCHASVDVQLWLPSFDPCLT